jgi:hypothetical protein
VGHVAWTKEIILYAYKIVVKNVKRRDNSEDLGVDGRIILEWILGK